MQFRPPQAYLLRARWRWRFARFFRRDNAQKPAMNAAQKTSFKLLACAIVHGIAIILVCLAIAEGLMRL